MANMFGAQEGKSILYKAGYATVTINDIGDAIFLQVGVSIGRQLQPIATLGQGIQWSSQPPSGQLTAQTILTNNKNLVDKLAGTGCDKLSIILNLKDAVCGSDASPTAGKLSIKDGYCSQIGFTMSGQQGYIGSDVTIMFTACELS